LRSSWPRPPTEADIVQGNNVNVTNLANGRSVTVVINDRGPFIDGRIIVTPPPDGRHALALTSLMTVLLAAGVRERGHHVLQGVGLYLRPGKKGFAIPDLAVVDEDFLDHPLPYNCYPPDVFRFVAEVTSSNWRDDTEGKATAYATVGVPVYLIADREHRKVVVLSRPRHGRYQSEAEYLPGDKAQIPGPVPCEIPVEDLL
jgi:Uma2 family endonuclease